MKIHENKCTQYFPQKCARHTLFHLQSSFIFLTRHKLLFEPAPLPPHTPWHPVVFVRTFARRDLPRFASFCAFVYDCQIMMRRRIRKIARCFSAAKEPCLLFTPLPIKLTTEDLRPLPAIFKMPSFGIVAQRSKALKPRLISCAVCGFRHWQRDGRWFLLGSLIIASSLVVEED